MSEQPTVSPLNVRLTARQSGALLLGSGDDGVIDQLCVNTHVLRQLAGKRLAALTPDGWQLTRDGLDARKALALKYRAMP